MKWCEKNALMYYKTKKKGKKEGIDELNVTMLVIFTSGA